MQGQVGSSLHCRQLTSCLGRGLQYNVRSRFTESLQGLFRGASYPSRAWSVGVARSYSVVLPPERLWFRAAWL